MVKTDNVQHLFNSSGNWIAFRRGKYIFDRSGNWIGWLPWDDGYIVDKNGNYFGTIFSGNRLYRYMNAPYRGYPGYSGYPGYPGYPGYVGYAGYSPLPLGVVDVSLPD
jgi:hypothetical protein